MIQTVAAALVKRTAEEAVQNDQLPWYGYILILLDYAVFLPVIVYLSYTLNQFYPVLAMVEDPSPPAYEPVSLNEDSQSIVDDGGAPLADEAARNKGTQPHITGSFRRIQKHVQGIAGWRSHFRGFACFVALAFASMFIIGLVTAIPFVPGIVASAIAALALCQLNTAWTHIVISTPSPKRFWHRLPPFKQAFHATALPTVVYYVAIELSRWIPKLLASLLALDLPNASNPTNVPQGSASDFWKGALVFLVSLALSVFLVIPSHVVLTRVQASMLPDEDETIVPFDRSFQNRVEPAIIGGKGFVTMRDAWETFERASWIRLVKLYVKIFLIGMATFSVIGTVLFLQWLAVTKK